MDTPVGFQDALRRTYLSGDRKSKGHYTPLKTGVSEFLDRKRTKGYEFAEKPNYVNPFSTGSFTQSFHKNLKQGDGLTYNSTNVSLERDTIPSPTKKESIARRHTDNYGTKLTPEDDEAVLTPCRWTQTGWKYVQQNSGYFNNPNKQKNMLGASYNKLDEAKNVPTRYKSHYSTAFKDKIPQSLDRGRC